MFLTGIKLGRAEPYSKTKWTFSSLLGPELGNKRVNFEIWSYSRFKRNKIVPKPLSKKSQEAKFLIPKLWCDLAKLDFYKIRFLFINLSWRRKQINPRPIGTQREKLHMFTGSALGPLLWGSRGSWFSSLAVGQLRRLKGKGERCTNFLAGSRPKKFHRDFQQCLIAPVDRIGTSGLNWIMCSCVLFVFYVWSVHVYFWIVQRLYIIYMMNTEYFGHLCLSIISVMVWFENSTKI